VVFAGSAKSGLRNACVFAVSQNNHQGALCAKILRFEANAIGAFSTTEEACDMQLKIQEKDENWRHYYPPLYFQTMAPFLHVLQSLGYPTPFLSNDKAVDWSEFYRFLWFEAPLDQQQEFLRRAEALPSFID
jgi:hypothetical protein